MGRLGRAGLAGLRARRLGGGEELVPLVEVGEGDAGGDVHAVVEEGFLLDEAELAQLGEVGVGVMVKK